MPGKKDKHAIFFFCSRGQFIAEQRQDILARGLLVIQAVHILGFKAVLTHQQLFHTARIVHRIA